MYELARQTIANAVACGLPLNNVTKCPNTAENKTLTRFVAIATLSFDWVWSRSFDLTICDNRIAQRSNGATAEHAIFTPATLARHDDFRELPVAILDG